MNILLIALLSAVLFYTPFICARLYPSIVLISEALIFIISVIFLVDAKLIKKNSLKQLFDTSLTFPVLIFLGITCAASAFSMNIFLSLTELNKLFYSIVFFYLCFNIAKLENIRIKIIYILLFGGFLISLYGLYQYFFGFTDTLNYIKNINLNLDSREMGEILNNLKSGRIFSTFLYSNTLAGYLIMLLPLSVSVYFETINKKIKFASMAFTLLFLAVLFFTKSIGGWISLFAAFIIFFSMFHKKIPKKGFITAGILILTGLILILMSRSSLFFNFESYDSSIVARIEYWKAALKIIKDNLFFGIGAGTFKFIQPEYIFKGLYSEYAHNYYLQIAAESGIFALLAFCFLIFVILKKGINTKNYIEIGIFVSVLAFLIHNFVDFDAYMWELNLIWWGMLGLLASGFTANERKKETSFLIKKSYIQNGLFVICVAGALFFGLRNNLELLLVFLFALIIVFLWILQIYRVKENLVNFKKTILDKFLFILFVLIIISFSFTSYQYATLIEFFKFMLYILVFYLTLNIFSENVQLYKISNVVINIAICLSLIGLFQYFSKPLIRITGVFTNPNFLAAYLVPVFLLAANLCLYELHKENKSRKLYYYAVSLIIIFTALVITQSRGGVITLISGIFISAFLWALYLKKIRIFLLTSAVIIMIVLFFLFNPFSTRLLHIDKDNLAYTRIEIYKSTLKMIKDYPLFGTGLGTYEDNFQRYMFPVETGITKYGRYSPFAHNELLDTGVGMGIPAMFICIIIFGTLIYSAYKLVIMIEVYTEFDIDFGLTAGIISALSALFVHSAFDSIFHLPAIGILLFLLLGMFFVIYNRIFTSDSNYAVPIRKFKIYMGFCMILGISGGFLALFAALGDINYKLAKKNDNILKKEIYLKNSIIFNPLSAQYYDELGKLYEKKYDLLDETDKKGYVTRFADIILPGCIAKAEQSYKKAYTLNKSDGFLHRHFALLFLKTNDYYWAISELRNAIVLNPYNPFMYFDLGMAYVFQQDYKSAREYFEKAVSIEPNYINAHYNLALIAEKLKDKKKAIEEYNRILLIKEKLKDKTEYSAYEKNLLNIKN